MPFPPGFSIKAPRGKNAYAKGEDDENALFTTTASHGASAYPPVAEDTVV